MSSSADDAKQGEYTGRTERVSHVQQHDDVLATSFLQRASLEKWLPRFCLVEKPPEPFLVDVSDIFFPAQGREGGVRGAGRGVGAIFDGKSQEGGVFWAGGDGGPRGPGGCLRGILGGGGQFFFFGPKFSPNLIEFSDILWGLQTKDPDEPRERPIIYIYIS